MLMYKENYSQYACISLYIHFHYLKIYFGLLNIILRTSIVNHNYTNACVVALKMFSEYIKNFDIMEGLFLFVNCFC